MRYVILEADKPTKKGTIYPKEVLQKALHLLSKEKPSGELPGFIGHELPTADKCTHIAKELKLDDGVLTAEIEFLPTEPGKRLERLADDVNFRLVGEAHVHQNPDNTLLVLDYTIICINAQLKS